MSTTDHIDNYPGFPDGIDGYSLSAAMERQAARFGAETVQTEVQKVQLTGPVKTVTAGGKEYSARTVIVAAGASPRELGFEEERRLRGKGVSYCATCDAPLYKGKRAAIVGFSPKEEKEAEFMAETAEEVLYFPMYKEDVALSGDIKVIREKPVAVEGKEKVKRFVTDKNTYEVDGVFFLRESVAPSQLVPGLSMEGSYVQVDRSMETSIEGCFACGDMTGLPFQYVKSAGEGNVAALSAVSYLDGKNKTK